MLPLERASIRKPSARRCPAVVAGIGDRGGKNGLATNRPGSPIPATARTRLRHYKIRFAARRDEVLRANRESLQTLLPQHRTFLAEHVAPQAV